jgi:hypothetical protein
MGSNVKVGRVGRNDLLNATVRNGPEVVHAPAKWGDGSAQTNIGATLMQSTQSAGEPKSGDHLMATETADCERKLRTKQGRERYRRRGASVEPVFGQMKDRQDARRFSVRGLERCRGEWNLHAAEHNMRKLHRASVQRVKKTNERAAEGAKKVA